MKPPARWWYRRSLRTRLTAAAVVVIAAALTLAGALLTLRLDAALTDAVDQTAATRADAIAERIEQAGTSGLVLAGSREEIVDVLTADGASIASSVNAPGGPLLPLQSTTATTLTQHGVALPGEEDEAFRVATRPVTTPAGQRLYVQAAAPLDDAQESVHELVAALAVGVPTVVAVLAMLTSALVGRALRPVEVLRLHAADIPGTALHRRLDVPDSGDELARLAETFNALLRRVEDAAQRQRRFIADAAHEIRSPVASLRTQLEVADRQADTSSFQQSLPALVEDTQRLSSLVEDLLRLARLDADLPLRRQPVDLDEVVLDTARRLRGTTPVVIDTSAVCAARVLGDADALERLITNLFDNALRYARHRVDVTLTADTIARLTITDDGPGIPADRREEVFHRFTRLDDTRTRDSGGTGLGLAIVKEVAERHRGNVRIDDAHPGARLLIDLPLAP